MPRQTWGPPANPRFGFGAPVRVESLGVVPARRIAVRGAQVHLDDGAGGDLDAAQLDVLGDEPAEDRVGRLPAHGLVDRAPQQVAVVAHRVEQRGIRAAGATSRIPSWRHVVPDPAVRMRRANP